MGPTAVLFVTLGACLLASVQGSAFITPVTEHPDQPGKCLYEGLAIAAGATITDHSDCTKLTCRKTPSKTKAPATFSVAGFGCNHASSWPANCHLETADLSKNYPDCCPQLECDGPPEGQISAVG